MAFLPHEIAELQSECVAAACERHLARTAPGGHAVVGALPSLPTEAIEKAVKLGIDLAIQFAGPAIKSATLSAKDKIRDVVSQSALEFADSILHGLQD